MKEKRQQQQENAMVVVVEGNQKILKFIFLATSSTNRRLCISFQVRKIPPKKA